MSSCYLLKIKKNVKRIKKTLKKRAMQTFVKLLWPFVIVIRLQRSTTHVHIEATTAAYCYRPSSVVCRSVGLSVYLSVCLSDIVVSPVKMAEPIEMSFGLRTRMGLRMHVLGGVTLAPPGEYHRTVHVRRWYGLLSNYFDHLLLIIC